MATLSCDKCFQNYSKAKNIPKILNCGHTFCHVCLTELFNEENNCPTCKSPLTKSVEEYLTNFIVFKQIKEQEKPCSGYHMECTFKNIEKELRKKKEMLVKNIGERTTIKNLISNGMTKLKQVSELDVEIRNSAEVEKLIEELEADIEKADAVLYCCGILESKPTYRLNEYASTSFFLYNLAIRLHKREDIYAYEMVQNSKPKYGKIVLLKDRINIHALTLSKMDKLSSVVSFEDLRACITAENFQTFIKIGEETLSFSITDSSFLASRFVKLCSGENGPTFKGANFVTPQLNPSSAFIETNLSELDEEPIQVAWPSSERNPPYKMSAFGGTVNTAKLNRINQLTPNDLMAHKKNQIIPKKKYILIEKYVLNDIEAEGFNDYDFNLFCAANETKCSVGEIVVQMNPDGSCKIRKCVIEDVTCKNVVAKVTEPCDVTLVEINPGLINDCGISLII